MHHENQILKWNQKLKFYIVTVMPLHLHSPTTVPRIPRPNQDGRLEHGDNKRILCANPDTNMHETGYKLIYEANMFTKYDLIENLFRDTNSVKSVLICFLYVMLLL